MKNMFQSGRTGQLAVMSGVLLLLVGLVIVYYAFTFLGTSEGSLQGQAASAIGNKIIDIESIFSLEGQEGAYIFMKNIGSADIEEGYVLVYLDDKGATAYISETIHPGETNIMVIDNWDVVSGDSGTEAKLVVPGKLISRTMTVKKPEQL